VLWFISKVDKNSETNFYQSAKAREVVKLITPKRKADSGAQLLLARLF
jgi:hypothetical protein